MKKIFVQTLTVLYLVVSLFSPIFAKDFCEHKLEIISMENVIYDNDTYRKIVYSVDDEKMMVYINDKELLVYDEANNLVGYQDMKTGKIKLLREMCTYSDKELFLRTAGRCGYKCLALAQKEG